MIFGEIGSVPAGTIGDHITVDYIDLTDGTDSLVDLDFNDGLSTTSEGGTNQKGNQNESVYFCIRHSYWCTRLELWW